MNAVCTGLRKHHKFPWFWLAAQRRRRPNRIKLESLSSITQASGWHLCDQGLCQTPLCITHIYNWKEESQRQLLRKPKSMMQAFSGRHANSAITRCLISDTRRRFRPFFRPRENAHNSAGCTASKAHQPWSEKPPCFVATGRKVQKEMSERAIKKPAS